MVFKSCEPKQPLSIILKVFVVPDVSKPLNTVHWQYKNVGDNYDLGSAMKQVSNRGTNPVKCVEYIEKD